jgi:hypothetical protein
MTSIETLENFIKEFLLTNVVFFLDNKKVKSGRLVLFTVRDFFCVFTLHDEIKNKKTIYEVPYPFGARLANNSLEFDYTVSTFCEKCNGIQSLAANITPKKTSKLFNKKLVITSHI